MCCLVMTGARECGMASHVLGRQLGHLTAPLPGLPYMKSWGPTRAKQKFYGFLRPKPRNHTESPLPDSLVQSGSQSQPRFQGRESRILPNGRSGKVALKKNMQLFCAVSGNSLPQSGMRMSILQQESLIIVNMDIDLSFSGFYPYQDQSVIWVKHF